MRVVKLILGTIVLALVAGCSGGGKSNPEPDPVPFRVMVTSTSNFLTEETPSRVTFMVVDTAGQPVPYDGTISVLADSGPSSPTSAIVAGGTGSIDVSMELAGDNFLLFDAPDLEETSWRIYTLPRVPVGVPGTGVGGAVLSEGATWDLDGAWAPSVLVVGTGYRMWYASAASGGPGNVGLAQSGDGVTWTRVGAAPVIGPAAQAATCHTNGASNPHVFRLAGGTFTMLYQGTVAAKTHLCRATSTDGIAWTVATGAEEDGSVLQSTPGTFDDVAIRSAAVVPMDDGTWLAVYAFDGFQDATVANPGPETLRGMALATSSANGVTWTKKVGTGPLGSILVGFAESPSPEDWDTRAQVGPGLLRDGEVLRLWISGDSESGKRIGYHVTLDPTAWGPHIENLSVPGNELWGQGAIGAFDDEAVELPSIVDGVDGVRRMYYTGTRTSDGVRRIGLASYE